MESYKLLRCVGIISCLTGILLILFGGIKTSENFRILSDIVQTFLFLILILLIFMPNDDIMKIAIIIGIITAITDFILETIAVQLNWWYPLGGTQYPPLLIIPLEMVFSFIFIGMTMAIILTFPDKIRQMNFKPLSWLKSLFKNPNYDWPWRFLLILLNAIIGTNGDYTAGPEIWVPGPHWHPIYTFFVWFGGGIFTLLIFYVLTKKIKKI